VCHWKNTFSSLQTYLPRMVAILVCRIANLHQALWFSEYFYQTMNTTTLKFVHFINFFLLHHLWGYQLLNKKNDLYYFGEKWRYFFEIVQRSDVVKCRRERHKPLITWKTSFTSKKKRKRSYRGSGVRQKQTRLVFLGMLMKEVLRSKPLGNSYDRSYLFMLTKFVFLLNWQKISS